jgi:ribosomal protein S18 acetylase RimI-like enzyme
MAAEAPIAYRRAVAADVPVAAAIIKRALDDLAVKQSQPLSSPEGDPMTPSLRHVLDVSPERFWVAEAAGSMVGFGAGFQRGHICYLAGLFVLPQWQGKGVGHELLRRAMDDSGGRKILPVVGSSGANVVSNGLYARRDMFPLFPSLNLTGRVPESLREQRLGTLRPAPVSRADFEEIRELDLYVSEIDRTADHAWLLDAVARPGWVLRRDGRLAGYAYLGGDGTSAADQVGPVATRRSGDMAAVLAFALLERGVGETVTVQVPAPNLVAQRLLWGAGLRMSGPVGLLGTARPFGHFDRYVFAGNVLM